MGEQSIDALYGDIRNIMSNIPHWRRDETKRHSDNKCCRFTLEYAKESETRAARLFFRCEEAEDGYIVAILTEVKGKWGTPNQKRTCYIDCEFAMREMTIDKSCGNVLSQHQIVWAIRRAVNITISIFGEDDWYSVLPGTISGENQGEIEQDDSN